MSQKQALERDIQPKESHCGDPLQTNNYRIAVPHLLAPGPRSLGHLLDPLLALRAVLGVNLSAQHRIGSG